MSVPVSPSRRSLRPRLPIALGAIVLATTLIAVVAIIRTGWSHWVSSMVRIVGLVVLSVLVLRGIRWARWVLIMWLSLAAIAFMAFSISVAQYPVGILLFIGMIALYVWAVVELTLADVGR